MPENDDKIEIECDNPKCHKRFRVDYYKLDDNEVCCQECNGTEFTMVAPVCPNCKSVRLQVTMYIPLTQTYNTETKQLSIPVANDLGTEFKKDREGIMCDICGMYLNGQLLSSIQKRLSHPTTKTTSHLVAESILICHKILNILNRKWDDKTLKKIAVAMNDANYAVPEDG